MSALQPTEASARSRRSCQERLHGGAGTQARLEGKAWIQIECGERYNSTPKSYSHTMKMWAEWKEKTDCEDEVDLADMTVAPEWPESTVSENKGVPMAGYKDWVTDGAIRQGGQPKTLRSTGSKLRNFFSEDWHVRYLPLRDRKPSSLAMAGEIQPLNLPMFSSLLWSLELSSA